MLAFPSSPLPSHHRSCALSRVLEQHPWVSRCRFRGPAGQEVPFEDVARRDGWLPALMAAAVWECRVPLDTFSEHRFVAFDEPTSHRFSCGFFLETDPASHAWAFPILAHLMAHEEDGWVDLEPAWTAWGEAVRGAGLGLTFRASLEFRPDPAAAG